MAMRRTSQQALAYLDRVSSYRPHSTGNAGGVVADADDRTLEGDNPCETDSDCGTTECKESRGSGCEVFIPTCQSDYNGRTYCHHIPADASCECPAPQTETE